MKLVSARRVRYPSGIAIPRSSDARTAFRHRICLTSTKDSLISVKIEITEYIKTLSPVGQKFILHWGEMGTRWGINRTVAQIHALLFLSPRPLAAEEIAATLGIARSNVSNSLHELQNWGIVRVVHVLGDRRDHFESMKDVFDMFRVIIHERKKREIDPTLQVLQRCIVEAGKPKSADRYTRERLTDLLQFFELAETAYLQLEKLPTTALLKLAKTGDKALRLLGMAKR
jgi:DNA-binding transcriptional regulator GbsR (MarR family)